MHCAQYSSTVFICPSMENPYTLIKINMDEGSNWYSNEKILDYSCKAILVLLASISMFIGSLVILISIGLFLRYVRIRFGSRVKPSAKRAIVITGATSGIGLALAKRFYRNGFSVFVGYFNSQEPGYAELQELGAVQSGNATSISIEEKAKLFLVPMDVRSEKSIDEAANEIEKLLDQHQMEMFCLVNNAGISKDGYFEVNALQNSLDTIETNYTGTVMVTKRFMFRIIKNKGRIIITGSGLSRLASPGVPIYSSTKAAVATFSEVLQESLKRYGASCRCVCPGNLLNKSNLVYSAIKALEDSVAQLSDEERKMYNGAIEDNKNGFGKFLSLRKNQLNEDPKQMAELYKISPEYADREHEFTWWVRCRDWLIGFLDGGNGGLSTKKINPEDANILEPFEDAICVLNAPQRLYPGNTYYRHIFGPILNDYMNPVSQKWLYNLAENIISGKS